MMRLQCEAGDRMTIIPRQTDIPQHSSMLHNIPYTRQDKRQTGTE